MIVKSSNKLAVISLLLAILWVPGASAHQTAKVQQTKVPQDNVFQALLRIEQKLPLDQRNLFSGSFTNWLALAHSVLDPQNPGPDDGGSPPPTTFSQILGGTRAASLAEIMANMGTTTREDKDDTETKQISNPHFDFQLSHVAGFTQATSSSAWCGHNVVTGFQSTLADLITGVLPFAQNPNLPGTSQGSLGVAFSENDGESFTDLGFLNPGPTDSAGSGTVMFGNPVVTCAEADKFYFLTSPFLTVINDPVNFTSQVSFGVGLSVSTDGGKRWAAPRSVVNKDANNLLDKAWLTIDADNHNRLYVTYVDLDLDGVFVNTAQTARCRNTVRNAIELVSSADGGRTWSLPSVIREDCQPLDSGGFLLPGIVATGPQVAVGADGHVFVSYMVFKPVLGPDGRTLLRNDLLLNFRRSSSHGNAFDSEVLVSKVTPTGDPAGLSQGVLQGIFNNVQVPAMAVAPVKHGDKDTIYIAWSDGRDNPQFDVLSATGTYNFSDILMVRSTDGGSSWGAPRPVSPTPDDFPGIGRDQFQPGIAVNRAGKVAVCYYDRRNDPQNNAVDHFCSISGNHGQSFHDLRQTTKSWAPIHAADIFLSAKHLGDYDTVAPHLAAADDDAFFISFQAIENAVPSIHGRSIRREQ